MQVQNDEVSLRAGQCHEVEMKVEKPGVLLEWEFRSEPKGIAFGMFYSRKDSASRSEVSVCACVCMCGDGEVHYVTVYVKLNFSFHFHSVFTKRFDSSVLCSTVCTA